MIKNLINKILLGNTQLSGMRTIILNTIVLILACWEFAVKDGGLFSFLCGIAESIEAFKWFCSVSETAFYASALVFISALNNVLRWLSDGPVGVNMNNAPARLTIGSVTISDGRAAIIAASVGASITAIIMVIVL